MAPFPAFEPYPSNAQPRPGDEVEKCVNFDGLCFRPAKKDTKDIG